MSETFCFTYQSVKGFHHSRKKRKIIRQFINRLDDTNSASMDLIEVIVYIFNSVATKSNTESHLVDALSRLFFEEPPHGRKLTEHFIIYANMYHNGLITHIKDNYSGLTDRDLMICSMISLGVEHAGICKALGLERSESLFNRRSHIRHSLRLDGSENLEDFFKSLSKKLGDELHKRQDELA